MPCTDQLEFCKWNDETFHDAVDISTVIAASSKVQQSVCHSMASQDINDLDSCDECKTATGDAVEICEEETIVEEDGDLHQSLENDDEDESLDHDLETHETPPEICHASKSFNDRPSNSHHECIDSAESIDSCYDGNEAKITMLGLSASSQSDSNFEPDGTTETATIRDQQVDVRSCLLDFDKSHSDDEAKTTIDESLTRAPELLCSAVSNEFLSQSRTKDAQSHIASHSSLPVENTPPPLMNSDEFDKNSFAKLQEIFVTSVMKPASNNESRVEEEEDNREVDLKCSISIQECRKAFAKLSGMMQGLGVSFIDDVSTPNPSSSRALDKNLSLIQEIPPSEARNDGVDEDKCCNASSCMNHRSSKTSLKSIRKTSTFTSAKDIFSKTMEARRKMISFVDVNDDETGLEEAKLAWEDSKCILNEVVKQVFNFVDE